MAGFDGDASAPLVEGGATGWRCLCRKRATRVPAAAPDISSCSQDATPSSGTAAAGSSSSSTDAALQSAVADALKMRPEERDAVMPAAVRTLVGNSEDPAETARGLAGAVDAARARLPADAQPLLQRLQQELAGEEKKDSRGVKKSGGEMAADSALTSARTSVEVEPGSEAGGKGDDEDEEGTPFCLGEAKLPLNVLLNITNGLAPDDL